MWCLQIVIATCVVAALAAPSSEDGKWRPDKYGNNGKYIPGDEGKYIHIPNPYIHMHNPYEHMEDPYVHQETRDQYRYILSTHEDNPYYKDGYYKNNGIKIIRQKHNYKEDKYDFDFETENKIRAEEKAVLKNVNTENEGIATSGFYEYIGPDGFKYHVTYTADERGFLPKVTRLETPYSGKWVYTKVN